MYDGKSHQIHPESDPLAALGLCKSARIQRLPVVNAEDQVIGLVTRHMLEQFLAKAPSHGVMKRQHSIEQVMASPALTVSPDYPLEEAARLMVVHKIGSLPVIDQGRLIGIITETDIFKQFVEILGGQAAATRLTVDVPAPVDVQGGNEQGYRRRIDGPVSPSRRRTRAGSRAGRGSAALCAW